MAGNSTASAQRASARRAPPNMPAAAAWPHGVGRAARTARFVLLFCVSITLASLAFGQAAGAFVVCLESRAVANIADKSTGDAIESYLKARFDSKVGKVVQITQRFFIVPPPEHDCKRCLYRIIMVSDGKIAESVIIVGSGTIWGGEPTSYPNLEGGYESIAFDVPGRPTGHIHVELPDTGSVPIIEEWSSGEMRVSSCKKIEP